QPPTGPRPLPSMILQWRRRRSPPRRTRLRRPNMKKLFVIALLSLSLGACAQLQTALDEVKGAYTFATTATVTPGQAGIVANAFDALKVTATNYPNYCITQKFPKPVCSAANRRAVIRGVNAGTAARAQIEAAVSTNQPVAGTIYNALVSAVQALQATPINTVKGS